MTTTVAVGSITIIDVMDGVSGGNLAVSFSKALSFTATDGVLDSGQANITFTAIANGVTVSSYLWEFSGFATSPTNSGTYAQTVTAAQFGSSKSATVTCTINGEYSESFTIVRLEKTSEAVVNKANGALQKAGDAITGPVTFATNGGILAATNADNGVFMGPNGLVGKKAGATTFAIDTAGNASFGGTLNAASGTFAGTLDANAINAVNTINIVGNAVTIPAGAEYLSPDAPNDGTIFTSSQTVCSTPSADFKGGSVMVTVTVRVAASAHSAYTFYAHLLRSGVVVRSYAVYTGTAIPQSHTFGVIDSPGVGVCNYSLKVTAMGDIGAPNGNKVYNASIQALGVVR